jgi:5' nucleotidase, deoxy (Pyrimidine), cytosolic type C protein (NT5C)
MKIGIDCDDVCCDFQKRFVALLNELYGRPPLNTAPIDWEWSNCQITTEERLAAWKKAATVYNLWQYLTPLPEFDNETRDYLLSVTQKHDVYFVTNRFSTPGASPMKQTKMWFRYNAGIESPNVLIAQDKGLAAKVLELDAFIDDRPKNCLDVLAARPKAHVFLADSSHNKTFNHPYIPRVKDLKTFLKLILSGAYEE